MVNKVGLNLTGGVGVTPAAQKLANMEARDKVTIGERVDGMIAGFKKAFNDLIKEYEEDYRAAGLVAICSAAVGSAILPIPVVGAFFGGALGLHGLPVLTGTIGAVEGFMHPENYTK